MPGRWTAAFAWSLTASSIAVAAPASAQRQTIDIPAGPLGQSLSRLSERTGASIGFSGRLPNLATRQVRHARSAADALRQMLAGTGYRAVATGPSSFRIELLAKRQSAPPPPVEKQLPDEPQPDIVVTALKRALRLSTIPATVRVARPADFNAPGSLPGSDRLAAELPSVSISSLGPGRNRLFLRGIGDGPLNGFNQGSVAVLLDESRLNYDAPDPDWALVDIDQIEVLEGPQGPLYGTGALGGIVKISTNRPDLDRLGGNFQGGFAITHGGDLSNSQALTLNVPLSRDRLALRAVAYRQHQAGWIDNVGGSSDANSEQMAGGRLALRWVPVEDWTVDATFGLQNRRARDSQYVDGGVGALSRPDRLPEPRDLDAKLAILTVKGKLGSLDLTSTSSITRQEATADYDATLMAPTLGASGPTLVDDSRDYQLIDQEIRIGSPTGRAFQWLAGASWIKATTDAVIQAEDATGVHPVLTLKRSIVEAALFGEASLAITPTLTVGGGARVFSSQIDDEGEQGGSDRTRGRRNVRASGSVSLSWTPSPKRIFFLRAATAYRPGGTNIQPAARQLGYDADELASVEAGARVRIGRSWSIDATAFATRWQNVQADELLDNGLIATRNAGDARNFGIEADLRWSPMSDTTLSAGLLVQSARLETASDTADIEDLRLPVVPQASLRIKASQAFHIGRWRGTATAGMQYVGATHISFDPVLDRRSGAHATADASIEMTDGDWTFNLSGQNLTGSKADTFAFGNPYRVRAVPQRTPLRPRTIGLSITRRF